MELYAVIDDETHVYLVMEYCRGGDLFKRLAVMGGCMEEGWVSSQACPSIHRKKKGRHVAASKLGRWWAGKEATCLAAGSHVAVHGYPIDMPTTWAYLACRPVEDGVWYQANLWCTGGGPVAAHIGGTAESSRRAPRHQAREHLPDEQPGHQAG